MNHPLIAITTDFGWGSSYVTQLKGVLLSCVPNCQIVDVAHDIAPQSIRDAELLMRGVAFALPVGCVHLVVVDPGVGTSRRGIAVTAGGMYFVGPDNGVLGIPMAQSDARAVHLNRTEFFRQPVSKTFHGRDIFAPIAAELASGLSLEDVGTIITDPISSHLPLCKIQEHQLVGEVLGRDGFGNLMTNLPECKINLSEPLRFKGKNLQWVRTYGEAALTEPVALVGSDGFAEIAVPNGSAAKWFGNHVVGECVQNRVAG